MVVMAPKDENELCRMLATAITHNGPIAMRYPRGTAAGVEMDLEIQPLPIGKPGETTVEVPAGIALARRNPTLLPALMGYQCNS